MANTPDPALFCFCLKRFVYKALSGPQAEQTVPRPRLTEPLNAPTTPDVAEELRTTWAGGWVITPRDLPSCCQFSPVRVNGLACLFSYLMSVFIPESFQRVEGKFPSLLHVQGHDSWTSNTVCLSEHHSSFWNNNRNTFLSFLLLALSL